MLFLGDSPLLERYFRNARAPSALKLVVPGVFALLSLHELVDRPIAFLRWSMLRFFLGIAAHGLTEAGDGREMACLTFARKQCTEALGSGRKKLDVVIDAIDQFAWNDSFMMNVGDEKGLILDKALQKAKPHTVLELGCYVGYSALRMVRVAPPYTKIFTIEWHENNAKVAREMFKLAEVADRITVVVGSIGDDGKTLEILEKEHGLGRESIDFAFFDHSKEAYLSDFKSIHQRGLFHTGTVVVGDNIKFPGAPDYLKYMVDNEGKLFTSIHHHTHLEYQHLIRDLVLETTVL